MIVEFNLIQIISILMILFGLFISLIFLIKYLLTRKKIIKTNMFKYRQTFLLLGFVFSFVLIFVIFNWTKLESNNFNLYSIDDYQEILVEAMIRTEQKKELPKPPPPKIIEVPESDIVEDQPEFLSVDIDMDDAIEIPEMDISSEEKPFVNPLKVKTEGDDENFTFVEQMPRFPGCEGEGTQAAKKQCADQKLMEYIYSNLIYPAIARESNIMGRVILRFVVNKYGSVSNVEILRDIGGGCGKAAFDVIKGMNNLSKKWTPGRQGGRKVNVYFTLPISFELK
jgi:protein TonB